MTQPTVIDLFVGVGGRLKKLEPKELLSVPFGVSVMPRTGKFL